MGKCLSSNRKTQTRSQKTLDERPLVPPPETPAPVGSEEHPVQYLISSIPSPLPQHKLKLVARPIQSVTLSIDNLSKCNLEVEMLQRIAGCLHRLSVSYHLHGIYLETLPYLQLACEIYARLDYSQEFNEVAADILLVYHFEPCSGPIPAFKEPLNERTAFIKKVFEKHMAADYEEVLKLSKFSNTNLNLSENLVEAGHLHRIWLNMPNEALGLYKKARELDPDNAKVRFYIGLAYRKLENFNKAAKSYLKGIEIDPNSCDCFFNLGNLYSDHYGNYEEAYACYKAALKVYGQQDTLATPGKIYSMLAETYAKQAKLEAALKSTLKGLKHDPYYLGSYDLCAQYAHQCGLKDLSAACLAVSSIFAGKPRSSLHFTGENLSILKRNVKLLLKLIKNLDGVGEITTGQQQLIKRQFKHLTTRQIELLSELYREFP